MTNVILTEQPSKIQSNLNGPAGMSSHHESSGSGSDPEKEKRFLNSSLWDKPVLLNNFFRMQSFFRVLRHYNFQLFFWIT